VRGAPLFSVPLARQTFFGVTTKLLFLRRCDNWFFLPPFLAATQCAPPRRGGYFSARGEK
jgi:hypothetical protein